MDVYQILCLLGLPSIISCAVIYCVRKIIEMVERVELNKKEQAENNQKEIADMQRRLELLERSQQAQLRDALVSNYEKYSEQHGAPLYAKDNFENCWKWYHSLGANGVMDDIHKKFMTLPIINEGADSHED